MQDQKNIITLPENVLDFYKDRSNEPRFTGIYGQGVDRWILVDSYDPWITHETAKILSSKLPVITYSIPNNTRGMNNANCMEYYIFNKTNQRNGQGAVGLGKQTPIMLKIWDHNQITKVGYPPDYNNEEGLQALANLKRFANYVHRAVYAAELMNISSNFDDTQEYAEKFIPVAWADTVWVNADRSGTSDGMCSEIKRILYMAQTPEEAEQKIVDLWYEKSGDLPWQRAAYYRILGQAMPAKLVGLKNTGKYTYFSV